MTATNPAHQTFFPGHDDFDSKHVMGSDGTQRCVKCAEPLAGRIDLSLSYKPPRPKRAVRCAQCNNECNDPTKSVTTKGGPTYCATACYDIAQRKMDEDFVKYGREPKGVSQPFPTTADAVIAMAKKIGELNVGTQREAKALADKLNGLSPQQIAQARSRATEALTIALFHTDPRVQIHLLLDAKNDDPDTMAVSLEHAWRENLNNWAEDAKIRAVKMVGIMDACGKASLR